MFFPFSSCTCLFYFNSPSSLSFCRFLLLSLLISIHQSPSFLPLHFPVSLPFLPVHLFFPYFPFSLFLTFLKSFIRHLSFSFFCSLSIFPSLLSSIFPCALYYCHLSFSFPLSVNLTPQLFFFFSVYSISPASSLCFPLITSSSWFSRLLLAACVTLISESGHSVRLSARTPPACFLLFQSRSVGHLHSSFITVGPPPTGSCLSFYSPVWLFLGHQAAKMSAGASVTAIRDAGVRFESEIKAH